MKIGIIIQARMSSTRLPGKVLKKLAGKEMLWHVVKRCEQSKLVSKVIVAASTEGSDDEIFNFCQANNIDIYRGDLDNVLKRYYECAKNHQLDVIARITSDCPLIDPYIIDESVKLFLNSNVDYVSNVLHRTWPRGLDCEVFSLKILAQAYQNSQDLFEQEHVTPYIRKYGITKPYIVEPAYEGGFRLTIDEEVDYRLMSHLYDKFYQPRTIVEVKEVLKYLRDNPNIAQINSQVAQKNPHT